MKCEHCPVADPSRCLGEGHPPVCRDVEAGVPGRAEQLVRTAEPPGLATMAANLTRSVARHVATGGRYASAEVQAERKAICFGNECGKHDAARDRCNACGCVFMDRKRSMASERCPLKPPLWSSV